MTHLSVFLNNLYLCVLTITKKYKPGEENQLV